MILINTTIASTRNSNNLIKSTADLKFPLSKIGNTFAVGPKRVSLGSLTSGSPWIAANGNFFSCTVYTLFFNMFFPL